MLGWRTCYTVDTTQWVTLLWDVWQSHLKHAGQAFLQAYSILSVPRLWDAACKAQRYECFNITCHFGEYPTWTEGRKSRGEGLEQAMSSGRTQSTKWQSCSWHGHCETINWAERSVQGQNATRRQQGSKSKVEKLMKELIQCKTTNTKRQHLQMQVHWFAGGPACCLIGKKVNTWPAILEQACSSWTAHKRTAHKGVTAQWHQHARVHSTNTDHCQESWRGEDWGKSAKSVGRLHEHDYWTR